MDLGEPVAQYYLCKSAKEEGLASKKEKPQTWAAIISKSDGGTAAILQWTWGQMDGKKQSRQRVYSSGKVNRNPVEQATLECKKMIKDKIRAGYTRCDEHFRAKNEIISADDDSNDCGDNGNDEKEVVTPPPHVMLAQSFDDNKKMFQPLPAKSRRSVPKGSSISKQAPIKEAHVMPKLDGIFCVANPITGELWSRSRVQITGLPHVEAAVKAMFSGKPQQTLTKLWIVGELYRHGWEFQRITGLVRRTKNTDDEDIRLIQYHVFDVILPPSNSNDNFTIRYKWLEDAFLSLSPSKNISGVDPVMRLTPAVWTNDLLGDVVKLHEQFVADGYEGAMIHPAGDPGYQQGKRSKWLLKYKTFLQEEFVCIDVLPQKFEGSNASGEAIAGAVLLKNDADHQFAATPNWTNPEKADLWRNRADYIGKIATVKFFCYTDGRRVPRFPVLVGFRDSADVG